MVDAFGQMLLDGARPGDRRTGRRIRLDFDAELLRARPSLGCRRAPGAPLGAGARPRRGRRRWPGGARAPGAWPGGSRDRRLTGSGTGGAATRRTDARLLALEDVDESLGEFDTLVMFGNNFGLFRSRAKARHLLRQLRPFVRRIVATSNDPSGTDDPVHSPIRSGKQPRSDAGPASAARPLPRPDRPVVRLSDRVAGRNGRDRRGNGLGDSPSHPRRRHLLCRRARTAWPSTSFGGAGGSSARRPQKNARRPFFRSDLPVQRPKAARLMLPNP
jgi:hypothetical protein